MVWSRATSKPSQGYWNGLADRLDRLSGLPTRGEASRRISQAIDALEKAGEEAVSRLTRRHAATGIPTREPLLARMQADGSGILGMIRFLDFDRLCAFDPTLGDQLLQSVSERLRAMLPVDRLLAHVDRAHLAIWFGTGASEEAARAEMGAIEYALSDTVTIGDRAVLPKALSLVVSISGEDPAKALARTLAQLSMASNGGAQPSPGLADTIDKRDEFALEQDLRLAVTRGQLRLCYQPLIDAARKRVCGAEALLRWQHPQLGAVSPSAFIPVMEAAGLAHDFGMWALNSAARQTRAWQTSGFGDLRVAVNVSGHQLERDDFATQVERTLSRHALGAASLEIELTEGVAMGDCARAARLFGEVRALGVAIAIDDFGTGFSSFSTLRKLAFDKIKIDREFVSEVDRHRDRQAICQSVIALARGLGIKVLAEGVERPEEYAWLRAHGCNYFQGYYFSPPLEADAFVPFVTDSDGLDTKLATDAHALQRVLSERLLA